MRLGSTECNKWRTLIKDAWNKATSAIQSVKDSDSNVYYPDGNGQVTIDYSPSQVNTNTVNIATANTNIATNTADIATNTADIATNASDIATLKTDVATNTANIATNTADIATNASDIDTLETTVAGKQDTLTAGNCIRIVDNKIGANGVMTSIYRNSSGVQIYRSTVNSSGNTTTTAQQLFTVGDNLTYDASTFTLSATDTTYTAGDGINISDDNVISAVSSAPYATQVAMSDSDSTTVSDKISTIETNVSTNASDIDTLETTVAGKQDTLTDSDYVHINGTEIDPMTVLGITAATGSTAGQVILNFSKGAYLGETFGYMATSGTANLFNLGTGLSIASASTNPTIDIDTTVIQSKLTAGDNIAIADDGTISATDTTYTAGTGIAISDANAISNSGVRTVSTSTAASSGTPPTMTTTGNRRGAVTVNTNGTTVAYPILGGYFQSSDQSTGASTVSSVYSNTAVILGGLKLNWGECIAYTDSTSYNQATVNFRNAFSNTRYAVIANVYDNDGNDLWSYQVLIKTKSTSSFQFHVSNGNSGTGISQDCHVIWFAIGF